MIGAGLGWGKIRQADHSMYEVQDGGGAHLLGDGLIGGRGRGIIMLARLVTLRSGGGGGEGEVYIGASDIT
jgi:hypothetical protein